MKKLYFQKGMKLAILLFAIMAFVGCNSSQKDGPHFTLSSQEEGLLELQTEHYQLSLDANQIVLQTEQDAIAMQLDNAQPTSPHIKGEEAYYEGIYPGTSLRFYEKGEGLAAYDFILQPGANVQDICLKFDQTTASISEEGDLIMPLSEGFVKHSKPYSYQEINGEKVEVESNFLLADNCVSFES